MKETPLQLPAITINSCKPSLEKNGKVYAQVLEVGWESYGKNHTFLARERRGLSVDNFTNNTEALFQLIQGDIMLLKDENGKSVKLPKDYIQATFLSIQETYLFFPVMVEFVNFQEGFDFDEEVYDWLVTKIFEDYGEKGFGVDPYSSFYMVQTDNGVFLINEFIFEQKVEEILPNTPIGLKIEETLLLSINAYRPIDEHKPLTTEEKRKLTLKQERQEAYQQMQERIRIRREAGEGGFTTI